MNSPVRAFVFDVGNTLWFEAKAPDMDHIAELEAEQVAPLLADWNIALSEPLAPIITEIWDAYMVAWRDEMDRGRYREPSLPFLIRGAMATRGFELSEAQAGPLRRHLLACQPCRASAQTEKIITAA